MTNHWIDLKNADVILAMGSNPASNHPISMKWIMRAREKGAKLICVDPRFTQTAAKADLYAPLRSGTDIAFLGGMINYILEKDLYFKDYVVNYTNASFLVNPDYKGPADLDGLFSGYNAEKRNYDKKTWSFQLDENGIALKDPTLQNPNCVFQLLKKHYSRYNVDKVVDITGTPKDKLLAVYELFGSTGKPDRAGTECYAMGWTQHTVGTQNIRTMTIIQQLLGNMGIAGGGINAMRGEANVQGSTDYGLLFHILPGYNPTPNASLVDLATYNEKNTPKTKEPRSVNWWSNRPKYIASYLKAVYGTAATKENDFGYSWLPKIDVGQNASWLMIFDKMLKGDFEGFFAWGQNPACSGANSNKTRQAMTKLKWLVNVNLFDNETGSFWRGPGMNPKEIQTEVFMLPCCSSMEKQGSIANSGRWAQWRYKAVEPIGQSMPDAEIINELFFKVKELYKKEGGAYPDPIVNLAWEYGEKDAAGKVKHVDVHAIAKEINGYWLEDVYDNKVSPPKLIGKKGDLVTSFPSLQADGTTSCGNWIYCNSYILKDGKEVNMMARRGKDDPTGLGLYAGWAWAWPVNRRIIYNRASVDLQGQPLDPKRPLVKWDAGKKAWIGDVPDGPAPPMGTDGKFPFIMKPDGVASIFGPGLAEGPFPEHYEALECPVEANAMSKQRVNPTIKIFGDKMDAFASCDARYPFVGTTYRVSEHWQTGCMTRHCSWLLEMQPQNFVEMSLELAKDLKVGNGETVIVSSARGEVKAVAVVSERFKPFKIASSTVHQVGLPWHFGWQFPEDGSGYDSANLLTPNVGDANTMIPESKAFMVNVRKA
ncbi:MAG: formate dehydrogenase-N subunit alpha [Desulfobacterales bacterium GWB2_56_26]|nr:MAG: formate dehydrogenase-N subunit alpha [Desulfobacterales bacterium GWB2_56_26]